MGQPVDTLGHAQWIAHIMSRLHLLNHARRKCQMDGMVYGVQRAHVLDMMQRYGVEAVSQPDSRINA